jgi:hypothetical protein
MDDLTVRPVTRDNVVTALRAEYDRQPRLFRLSGGQRRTIARVATGPRPPRQFNDGSGGKLATMAS